MGHVSVDHNGATYALQIIEWTGEGHDRRVLEIPVEEIPNFIRSVVASGTYALADAATALEVGHCESCGNTGLVREKRGERIWTVNCANCRPRYPKKAFQNAPKVGRRGE